MDRVTLLSQSYAGVKRIVERRADVCLVRPRSLAEAFSGACGRGLTARSRCCHQWTVVDQVVRYVPSGPHGISLAVVDAACFCSIGSKVCTLCSVGAWSYAGAPANAAHAMHAPRTVRSRGGPHLRSTLTRLHYATPWRLAAGSVSSEVPPDGSTRYGRGVGIVGPELAAVGLSATRGRHTRVVPWIEHLRPTLTRRGSTLLRARGVGGGASLRDDGVAILDGLRKGEVVCGRAGRRRA